MHLELQINIGGGDVWLPVDLRSMTRSPIEDVLQYMRNGFPASSFRIAWVNAPTY